VNGGWQPPGLHVWTPGGCQSSRERLFPPEGWLTVFPMSCPSWIGRTGAALLPRSDEAAYRKAYRRDIARTLRMVYRFGVDANLVSANPAERLKAPAQVRSERIKPFESW